MRAIEKHARLCTMWRRHQQSRGCNYKRVYNQLLPGGLLLRSPALVLLLLFLFSLFFFFFFLDR